MDSSPFKFLNSYEKEDKDAFFGREEEVDLLYQMVFQSNLILVYGQSGTGKTSLIKCGLANRFLDSDWFYLYIRREQNINQSLEKTLQKYIKISSSIEEDLGDFILDDSDDFFDSLDTGMATKGMEIKAKSIIHEYINNIYNQYLKPINLVFDQFEELFILGTETEQKEFIETVRDLVYSELPCTVIFVMREEYIAWLYNFEKQVPKLFQKRIRIEAMSRSNTERVIIKSADRFNISLQPPDKIAGLIVDKLSEGRSRIHLPYLQVVLDKLYRIAAQKQPTNVVFDIELVKSLGGISDVLEAFLEEQLAVFEKIFNTRNHAIQFLKPFVSEKGTKRPIERTDLVSKILVRFFDKAIIDQYLTFFVEKRILRPLENEQFELSHDSLAAKIFQTSVEGNTLPVLPKIPIPNEALVGFRPYKMSESPLFFGRKREIKEVFNLLVNEKNSNVLLLYGSGAVGKTSLVKAGLMPYMNEVGNVGYINLDKFSLERGIVRQCANIFNKREKYTQESHPVSVFMQGVPNYIFLDQLEEVYIWYDKVEQDAFFSMVKSFLDLFPNVMVCFIISEDYLASLTDFEQMVPDLLDNRRRIEPLSIAQATEVVKELLNILGIAAEDDATLHKILNTCRDQRGHVNLAYLQTYLKEIQKSIFKP